MMAGINFISWSGMCPDSGQWVMAVGLLIGAYITYRYFTRENWAKYGVKQGSMGLDLRDGITKLIAEHGDTVGISQGGMVLVTRDLDIVKQVLVRDFNNFVDKLFPLHTKSLLGKGIFFLEGQDWRRVRQVITPAFSTSKLKLNVSTIESTAKKLVKALEEFAKKDKLVPVKDSASQYTSEIIARAGFGLQADCVGNEQDEFAYYCKRIFKVPGKVVGMLTFIFFFFPNALKFLVKTLGISFFDAVDQETDQYLISVLKGSIAERENFERQGGRKPVDLLQNLVSAKAAGDRAAAETASGEDAGSDAKRELGSKTITSDELMGQCQLLIFGAFETTSTTLQMCLYSLAKHPDIQEKVIEEIDRMVTTDSVTYDQLSKLKYMEQVIDETLRLYPPVPATSRKAYNTRTYGSITIPKDAGVMIPIFAVHLDPKSYPNPEEFNPEHFSEENKAKRDPITFLPFGSGPRMCIGMRMAYLELKIALVHLFKRFRFELNDRTVPKKGEELKIRTLGFLVVDDPIQLQIRLREDK